MGGVKMSNKKKCVLNKLFYKFRTSMGSDFKIPLPDGCLGVLLVFESKKAARKFYKEVSPDSTPIIQEVEYIE
jgi:hypothetical protein